MSADKAKALEVELLQAKIQAADLKKKLALVKNAMSANNAHATIANKGGGKGRVWVAGGKGGGGASGGRGKGGSGAPPIG